MLIFIIFNVRYHKIPKSYKIDHLLTITDVGVDEWAEYV